MTNVLSFLNKTTPWLIFTILPISMTSYFSESYTTVKWVIVFLVFFIESINLFSIRNLAWINTRLFSISLGIIFLGATVSLLKNLSLITVMGSIEFLIFWALFFVFLTKDRIQQMNLLRNEGPIYLGLVLNLIYAGFQFYKSASGDHFLTSDYNSFFGNNNMVSEYILLTVPIQIMLFKTETEKAKNLFKSIALATSIFFLIMWVSRSAWISLAIIIVLLLFFRIFSKKIILTVLFALILSHLGWYNFVSSGTASEIAVGKKASAIFRKNLIITGLAMAKDSPLGIGSTQFQFNSLAYQKFTTSPNEEDTIYKSPHNEVLKIAVEYGWLTLIGAVLLFSYLLRLLCLARSDKDKIFFFSSYFSIFCLSILFQFPSENAFPFIFLSVLLAQFISSSEKNILEFKIDMGWAELIKYAVLIVSFFLIFSFSLSYYLEYNFSTSSDYSKLACNLYPSNWKACLNRVQADIAVRNLKAAKSGVVQELSQRPFNYVALKLLTITNFESGNIRQACEAGWLYDEIFNWQSSWNGFLRERCPAPEEKSWTNAIEYRENYLQKLNTLFTL